MSLVLRVKSIIAKYLEGKGGLLLIGVCLSVDQDALLMPLVRDGEKWGKSLRFVGPPVTVDLFPPCQRSNESMSVPGHKTVRSRQYCLAVRPAPC